MDPRNQPTTRGGVDINEVDQRWIANCTSVKKMRAAVRLLKDDGYYPDLTKIAEDRLCELDPEYKRRKELPHATAEEKTQATDDLDQFLAEMEKPKEKESEEAAEAKRREEEAKEQRMKGNECMAAQDYKEALGYYERSLKLDSREAATYSNRALAYLKLGNFKEALGDANIAIGICPNYLKAYHRRAEAELGLEQYAKAYADIKAIVRIEPANASVCSSHNDLRCRRRRRWGR